MIKFLLGGLCGVLAIVFMVQNTETIEIAFLAWTVTTSRALIMIIMLAIGIVIGGIGTTALTRRRRR